VRSARSYRLSRQTPHTLVVKDLRLRGFLRVDAVECEGIALALVLRVWDLDDGLGIGRLSSWCMRSVDYDVLLNLSLEEGADASNHADAHCVWRIFLRRLGVGCGGG
jgi:hypothetical protein